MKITLIYHLYRNTENLKKSLESIHNQKNKNFEIVFVDDGGENDVKDIFESFDWSSFENIKIVSVSQNLGHSFAFNESLKHASGDYVYYCGSNITLKNNFFEKLYEQITNDPDVVSFSSSCQNSMINSVENILKTKFNQSMKNKLFKKSFLKINNIELINFKYYPLLFLIAIIFTFKKWQIIGEDLCDFSEKKRYSYNLYNMFEQADLIMDKYSNTETWKRNKEKFEYFLIASVLCTFLIRIFKMYEETKTKKLAMWAAEKWLTKNIPEWKKNKVILNNENFDQKELNKFLIEFEFDQKYIELFLEKNEQ